MKIWKTIRNGITFLVAVFSAVLSAVGEGIGSNAPPTSCAELVT